MVDKISIVDGGYKLTYNWEVPYCTQKGSKTSRNIFLPGVELSLSPSLNDSPNDMTLLEKRRSTRSAASNSR